MCLYPKLIKNPKYKPNKKNGGQVPPVSDPRVLYVPVACTDCIECRKQKSREWRVRLQEDIKMRNLKPWFITLTFSNDSYAKLCQERSQFTGYYLDNAIATLAVRRFLERWRKHYKKSLRHWLVTELGHNGTENIHLHGIIWTNQPIELLDKYWQYGYTWKGNWKNGKLENYVNERTISYITKYIFKMDLKHPNYKPIILTSAGIGGNYKGTSNKFKEVGTDETYRTNTGHRMALPVYWRNKIYTDEERERLWINKLNEQKRYVLGNQIDISNGQEQYAEQLAAARKYNTKMGYQNGRTTKDQIDYENKIREIMQLTRINNSK